MTALEALPLGTVRDPADPAALPFGSNSMQHGTAVFDGIRCYATDTGRAVFRLDDHVRRLLSSADLLGIRHEYDFHRVRNVVLRAARVPQTGNLYLRPVLYTPDERLGVDLRRFRFALAVEVYAMPSDAGPPTRGLRLTVSPWCRPAVATFPAQAKATGSYVVSALARTAAAARGFDDAVQLDPISGAVAEATIANVFIARNGQLLTPWRKESLLPGITRHTVLVLARRLGVEVRECSVRVTDLHRADELFLTGTAAELVPATEIDGHRLDPMSPVFQRLADAYRDAVRGRDARDLHWLTDPVTGGPTGAPPVPPSADPLGGQPEPG